MTLPTIFNHRPLWSMPLGSTPSDCRRLSVESLHWPNHPTLLGSTHLTLLYHVLRICWAQSPVLDAEELGNKELALQKVTIWWGPCEAIEDSPAGARKALSNRRTERSDPGGKGTDLKGWVRGEERRGYLGGRGWKRCEQHFGFRNEPQGS